jgi:hypothetical protein
LCGYTVKNIAGAKKREKMAVGEDWEILELGNWEIA